VQRWPPGLGLRAPAATKPLADVAPSPALSQIGKRWPTTGRTVGIIVDADDDLDAIRDVRQAVFAGGMTPLIIAARGGTLDDDTGEPVHVQRTFLTARSVEFDAILVTASPAPAPDAVASKDAKSAATTGDPAIDPRAALLLSEAYRHAKAIGAWGQGTPALSAAGCDPRAPGIVVDDDPQSVLTQVVELMGEHRLWHRFATV
jgi:catalase